MKKLMMTAAATGLLAMTAGTATAATEMARDCEVFNKDFEQKLMENPEMRSSYASPLVRDVRQLRDAAMTLAAYGKGDACEEVAEVIQDMVENPKELQRTAADGSKVPMYHDEPAAYTYADARKVTDMGARLRAERIIGTDVRGRNNDNIGEISDVVVDPQGKSAYVILSYGGFLGLGEQESAVPFDLLRLSADGDVYYLPMTEEELEKAPRFDRGDFTWSEDDAWVQKNDAYFRGFGGKTD